MWRFKRLLRDTLLIGLLGIVAGVVAAFFEIEVSTMQIFLIICCGIYLVVTILYYFVFMQPYRRRVLQQNADMEAGEVKKALADIEAMRQEPRVRKSKYLTQCCQINLSAAYCRLEQYDRALEALRALPEEKLREQARLVYHLNTCICQFYKGSERDGLDYYLDHRKIFQEYQRSRNYGGNLAVLRCWASIAQGDSLSAWETLEHAKVTWTKPSLLESYEKLEQRLAEFPYEGLQ